MSVELKVPPVGESITEVAVGEWLHGEGTYVRQDEPVVVVESDKVNLEVPAPVAGKVVRVRKKQGESAKIGDVLAEIEPGEAPKEVEPARPTDAEPAPRLREGETLPASTGHVMPSAARVLAQGGLSGTDTKGTGPGGRVLKEDAQRAVAASQAKPSHAPEPPAPPKPPAGDREEEVVPMTPLRQTVARRLVEAQQNAALLTTFNEIDMSAVLALRTEHKAGWEERHGLKLGFMSFFVKAVVDGLTQFPALNAEIRDNTIVYRRYHDIGIAVGGGKGLVVPILRNAEKMSFAEIEKQIADFGRRAKENRIKLEELQGGTFSITNGGIYGSLLSTPIVNPPQSGILGMHAIQERPVAVDGQVVIRPMMYVAVTYDHRLVDGREAVSFLKRVKACVEQPVRLLLEV